MAKCFEVTIMFCNEASILTSGVKVSQTLYMIGPIILVSDGHLHFNLPPCPISEYNPYLLPCRSCHFLIG